MQPALLLPTTGTMRTTVVLLSAADDHACSFLCNRLFIMLTHHDIARSMLVPTTNQKKAATSSSLSVEELEERPVLPTKMVVNGDRTRLCD